MAEIAILNRETTPGRFDIISTILWHPSLAQFAPKVKNRETSENHASYFLISESMCDVTDVLATIYDRKTSAWRFDTIHNILRYDIVDVSVSCNLFSKVRNTGVNKDWVNSSG